MSKGLATNPGRSHTRRARTPSTSPGSRHGSGEIIDLPDLLQSLCDAGRTGTLVLTGPSQGSAYLYLRAGELAAAFDGDPDFLGRALVKVGALSAEQLHELLGFFRPTPATLARTLLERGQLEEADLGRTHAFVIQELLAEVLSWERPRPEFHDGPPLPELVRVDLPHPGVSLPTKATLMNAVCQLDEWGPIRATLPSDRDVPVRVREGERDDPLLSLVDGVRDVGEVVALAPMPRLEASSSLAEHARAGRLRLLEVEELLQLAERATAWKLIAVCERVEELDPGRAGLGLRLAEAYEALGQFEAASRRFLELARELRRSPEGRDQSTALIRRAYELRPEDGSLQRRLIEQLIEQDELEEAALQAEAYVDLLRGRGDPIATLRAARGLLEQLSEFQEMLVLQAELSAEAGNRLEAVRLFRRVAEIRLGAPEDEYDAEEKLEVLEQIIELDPEELNRLAADMVGRGERRAAQDVYREVLRGNPFDLDCREALAGLLVAPEERAARLENLRALARLARIGGEPPRAVAALERYLEELPDDPDARTELLACRLEIGGAEGLSGLKQFALASARLQNQGDLEWAIRKARDLEAPAEWFGDVPRSV